VQCTCWWWPLKRPIGNQGTAPCWHRCQHNIATEGQHRDWYTASPCSQAANQFQAYVRDALAFSIQRGGLLYGTVDEDHNVKVCGELGSDVVAPDMTCMHQVMEGEWTRKGIQA
jgi:hypothetical protein